MQEDLQRLAIRSVFWVGSIKFLSQMLSWGVTILLIRLLSPEDYGPMAIALAYMLFVPIFFDLSIGEAVSWLLVYPVLFVYLLRMVACEVEVSFASMLQKVRPALTGVRSTWKSLRSQ